MTDLQNYQTYMIMGSWEMMILYLLRYRLAQPIIMKQHAHYSRV